MLTPKFVSPDVLVIFLSMTPEQYNVEERFILASGFGGFCSYEGEGMVNRLYWPRSPWGISPFSHLLHIEPLPVDVLPALRASLLCVGV